MQLLVPRGRRSCTVRDEAFMVGDAIRFREKEMK
jgi:hypothetical protein